MMLPFACGVATLGALASVPGRALADETEPPPPPSYTAPTSAMGSAPASPTTADRPFARSVGGHVGFATPLVTLSSNTTTIADQFTMLNPIGIGIKVSENLTIDFEMVVSNALKPAGGSGLVIDPGAVYNFGAFAAGLRVAVQINANANVGLIPLINKGLVDLGGSTWFVEAAFPTFLMDKKVALNMVLHTGIGF